MADIVYVLAVERTSSGKLAAAINPNDIGKVRRFQRVRDVVDPVADGERVHLHTDADGVDRLLRAMDAKERAA